MAKINIATQLNVAFTGALRTALADDPEVVDSRKYLAPARDAVAAEVARLLRLLALRVGPEPDVGVRRAPVKGSTGGASPSSARVIQPRMSSYRRKASLRSSAWSTIGSG